ncbi:exonuclease domain-containing protein [Enterococcus gilvus]|uniref:DNA polymerase III polC-type n=1 Tax=Enterococcus gilvus ATCC BAA-350 TaxID=1158614 RepID=R2XR57_9ENTE|nr:exonuclease domain-containing protein [Enterococcus gilvus]EOI57389.1 exonuclease, DNA polymerase III, epsilon subunit [Enterococcus gilvus ATCC BAA-350]EOW83037.1 hypothetical protein I592_02362 [Enterococcus gilvus ATCC BAA-350]OJG41074.1 exonuclease, DNA polymerase III, epsilon subunit [Enterococcus gilvus]
MATYEEISYKILKDKYVESWLKETNYSDQEAYEFIHYIVARFSGIKRNPNSFYVKSQLPKEYVSFDIETTGLSKNDEIIQIAAIHMKNGSMLSEFSQYVKPKTAELSVQISYITGITNENIKDAPYFEKVQNDFNSFIGNLPLIGHNATSFDLPFLKRQGFNVDSQFAIDTVYLAQSCKELNIDNCKLETLKNHYAIDELSHNALSDAKTTAKVYEYLRKGDYAPRSKPKTAYPKILKNKRFCYTGNFKNFSRQSLQESIENYGGIVTKSVSKKTDFLVTGQQIAKNLKDGVHSSSEIKCMELMKSGFSIEMITEDQFIAMINEKN